MGTESRYWKKIDRNTWQHTKDSRFTIFIYGGAEMGFYGADMWFNADSSDELFTSIDAQSRKRDVVDMVKAGLVNEWNVEDIAALFEQRYNKEYCAVIEIPRK